jgi:hypothetical protein
VISRSIPFPASSAADDDATPVEGRTDLFTTVVSIVQLLGNVEFPGLVVFHRNAPCGRKKGTVVPPETFGGQSWA